MIETLHLLALCRWAVQLAQRRCPPPLPQGPDGAPRTYREESLLLIALLKTLLPALPTWDVHDWLVSWPALAFACGLPQRADGAPRIPSPSQSGVLIPVTVPTTRRSAALHRQTGRGHEPLAEKTFTIGLTRSSLLEGEDSR